MSPYIKKRKTVSIITLIHNYSLNYLIVCCGDGLMNKTLIVLGTGILGVIILLRFVPLGNVTETIQMFNQLLNVLEIAVFVIIVVGIFRRD